MPKVVMILQARMGSTRLPGKSLFDLAGAPLVGRILERVKRCQALDAIVLATSTLPENDPLARLALDYGVHTFRGSETDLLDRYYQAACAHQAEVVVRLPADNPVPEPAEIDRIVRFHKPGHFSSNLAQVFGNGYPDGIGSEVFDLQSLEYAWKHHFDPQQREHVHLSFFNYQTQEAVDPKRVPVATLPCPAEFRRPDLVLDVNTRAQYDFIRALYEALYPKKPNFHITDIIDWYDNTYRKEQR